MRKNNLLLLGLVLLLTACATIPRDEIEPYETGIEDYENGRYYLALSRFREYAEQDSLYYPLSAAVAHAHYELAHIDSASMWLERSARLTDELPSEYLAYQAERNLESSQTETLGFLDYVTSIGRRYGIDAGLLLAIMQQESSLRANAVSKSGAVGMMQLMPATGKALGMTVPEDNYVKEPPIRDHEMDERFHPGRNIAGGASHLNFLLNHYRFGTRNTNLCKALAAYNAGTGNVRDSIPSYCNHYINRIAEFYRQNRYRFDHHRELEDAYYKLNPEAPGFSRHTRSSSFPMTKMKAEYERIEEDCATMIDDRDRSIVEGHLALMAESLDLPDSALAHYNEALSIVPDSERIRYNRAMLLFKRQDFQAAIDDLVYVDTFDAMVMRISCRISLTEYDRARKLIEDALITQPDAPELYELKGVASILQDDVESSIGFFQRAMDLRGSQTDINNLLTSFYARYYRDRIEIDYVPVRRSGFAEASWLDWPLPQRYISSYFGWRPNAIETNWMKRLEQMEFHSGIDIPAGKGEPVHASADGIVWDSTIYDASGESIYIQHDNGWFTCYFHLSSRMVEKGDRVKKGDVIGLVGSTGRSTGDHLHFGLFDRNWKPVNPLLYLTGY